MNNGAAVDATAAQTLAVTAEHSLAHANLSLRCHAVLLEKL